MGRGAGKARRVEKREEAQARDAASTYNAEIGRVVREQNVSPRTARHVVNAERKISRAKAQYRAGFAAMAAGKPLPPNASRPFRRGYEMATEVDA
jgi:hypothetical protein